MKLDAAARRKAVRAGRWAENLCAWHLRARGYRILVRRLRTTVGEIDILARRGRVMAVIEVKARPSIAQAAESIGATQRKRVRRAAEAFLAQNPSLAGLDLRFDAMLAAPWRLPVHVRDAWRPE